MGLSFIISICFIWIGFVAAISFMESWLKFRAPGVDLATGLSIGRLIFKVLNRIEWVCFILIASGSIFIIVPAGSSFLVIAGVVLLLILIAQTGWLLPVMDKRARRVMNGEQVEKSKMHIYYVGLEMIKLVFLVSTGVTLFGLLQ